MANEIPDGLALILFCLLAVGVICITIGIGLVQGLACALVFFGICCIGLFAVNICGLAITDDKEEEEGRGGRKMVDTSSNDLTKDFITELKEIRGLLNNYWEMPYDHEGRPDISNIIKRIDSFIIRQKRRLP